MDVAIATAMIARRAVMTATTESIATSVVRVPRPAAALVRVPLNARSVPLRAMARAVRTALRWRAARTAVMRARVGARAAPRRVARAMTAVVVLNVPPVDRSHRARAATPRHVRAARRAS